MKEITGLFFDHMHEAALVCELVRDETGNIADWRFQNANAAALRAFGGELADVVGKSAAQLFPAQAVQWITGEFERARAGEMVGREAYLQKHWYLISSFIINETTFAMVAADITRRKLAEEELRAMTEALEKAYVQAAFLARLPDENPNPVLRLASDGSVLYRNRVAAQCPGWVAEDGQRLTEPLRSLAKDAWAQGAKVARDVQVGEQYYLVTITPYLEEGYINLYATEVTGRKQAEDKFFKVFHAGPVAMGITRLADGRYLDVNTSFSRVSGWSREEAIGKTGEELGVYENAGERDTLVRLLREQGSIHNYEMPIRTRVGEQKTGLFSFECIELNGEACILTTCIDISARKREHQALEESKERERERANELEALMDAVPAIIWISRDPQCREMIGNRLGYEFLQMGPDANVSVTAPEYDIAAQPYRNIKDGVELDPYEMPMQVAARTGQPAYDYTFDLVFQDGTVKHLMGNVNPLVDREDKPYGAIGAFIDITPIREMEAREVEARAQIEVQNRLMDYREQERLGIARDLHDGPIQTLASTAFNIQFVKEAYEDPALRVELEGIAHSVKNAVRELREIVNDLRPPALIRFGLARAIRIHAEDVEERHPEITIKTELAEEHDHLSEQACLTLFRIFQEGLNNAVRHSGASEITVRYGVEKDAFVLELSDNGQGFDVPPSLSEIASEGHFGLVGMRERAMTVGAELTIVSAPSQGTRILVRGPLLGKNRK